MSLWQDLADFPSISSERPSALSQQQQASGLKCLEFSSGNIKQGTLRCPVLSCPVPPWLPLFWAKSPDCLDPVEVSQKDFLMVKNRCAVPPVHACRLATGRKSNSELCRSLKWQPSPEVRLVRCSTARHFEKGFSKDDTGLPPSVT